MTKDEALKLALEALEQLQGGCTDHDDGTVEAITVWCPEVIEAIEEALAQPEPDDLTIAYERGFVDGMSKQAQSSVDKAVNAMTPPEYEFVTYGKAWSTDGENVYVDGVLYEPSMTPEQEQQSPKRPSPMPEFRHRNSSPEQEPVAVLFGSLPVYDTAPPQPEERNFCPRCGKRLHGVLGNLSIHTCTPPKPINWVDHEPT